MNSTIVETPPVVYPCGCKLIVEETIKSGGHYILCDEHVKVITQGGYRFATTSELEKIKASVTPEF